MTDTLTPTPPGTLGLDPTTSVADLAEQADTPPVRHPHRWRLNRAGITNVWQYFNAELIFAGGRLIFRGTNGAGKSRAMEMLLPYLFDADRRRIDSTGSGHVRLESLMKEGLQSQTNRLGYLWLELERDTESPLGEVTEHKTLGALIRFSASTAEAKAWYFITPLRVGHDLTLVDRNRQPLSRADLSALIGEDNITERAAVHRERVGTQIFGLGGPTGAERYDGLLQLLHVLRSPDVGSRIEGGQMPRILSDALPPLSDAALTEAGSRLDDLAEAREAQSRMEQSLQLTSTFLKTYRRYASGVLHDGAADTDNARAALETATRAEEQARAQQDQTTAELEEATRLHASYKDDVANHEATITALRDSDAYRGSIDLENRTATVKAVRTNASGRYEAAYQARVAEFAAVTRANAAAASAVDASGTAARDLVEAHRAATDAGVPASALGVDVTLERRPGPAAIDTIRDGLDADLDQVNRPVPDTLTTSGADEPDLAAIIAAAHDVERSAQLRADLAEARGRAAESLARQRDKVDDAEENADSAETAAAEEAERAETAAEDRDQQARMLARDWREWTSASRTRHLLGEVAWEDTPAAPLLADLDALVTDPVAGVDLRALDTAATEAATDARTRLAQALAQLELEQGEDDTERARLVAEQERLRAAHDPEPPDTPWAAPPPDAGVALWRALDFSDDLDQEARAGLEGALLASGLLTATVDDSGALVAENGQTLVSPNGPAAATPLTQWLRPDPATEADQTTVSGILNRVSAGAGPSASPWVDVDGAWGNGPARGLLALPVARHIGAAARAAAREARIAEIDETLADLDRRRQQRTEDRDRLDAEHRDLDEHVRTAPKSWNFTTAASAANTAATHAAGLAARARTLRAVASEKRAAWVAADTTHRAACDRANLPHTTYELRTASAQARTTRGACGLAARSLDALRSRRHEYDSSVAALEEPDGPVAERRKAEAAFDRAYRDWRREETELATLTEALGTEATQVRAALAEAQQLLETAKADTDEAAKEASDKATELALAGKDIAAREQDVNTATATLRSALDVLVTRLKIPGLAQATVTSYDDGNAYEPGPVEQLLTEVEACATLAVGDAARRLVRTVRTTVAAAGNPVDETALFRESQRLGQALQGSFDVLTEVVGHVHLVELSDAESRDPIAQAVEKLITKVDRARAALTAREQKVFTDFVIGGMGEELRRKLGHAQNLIDAMNTSLASISTSHGIRVRVTWKLTAEAGTAIHRVRELCSVAGAMRPESDTDELVRLLMGLVEETYALDRSAGYADALRAALDYRTWHHVSVELRKPEHSQWVTATSRSHLSQGERRFVAYVALFAAADAYLSGLPSAETAARFITLDDAFAKVDDRTIGKLMGLLVRLDLDFCMTGHALWGTYEQVPQVEVYEVRRETGSPAVMTRVHWDGHTRHIRVAGSRTQT